MHLEHAVAFDPLLEVMGLQLNHHRFGVNR
jgi:hypothetical protein